MQESTLAPTPESKTNSEAEEESATRQFEQNKTNLLNKLKGVSNDDLEFKDAVVSKPGPKSGSTDEADLKQPAKSTGRIIPQGKLSIHDVACIAFKEGFRGISLVEAVAIALGESGNDTDSKNRNAGGSIDYGLWQMNGLHQNLFFGYGGDPEHEENKDAVDCALQPYCNAQYTHTLWAYGGAQKGGCASMPSDKSIRACGSDCASMLLARRFPKCQLPHSTELGYCFPNRKSAFNPAKWHAMGKDSYPGYFEEALEALRKDSVYCPALPLNLRASDDKECAKAKYHGNCHYESQEIDHLQDGRPWKPQSAPRSGKETFQCSTIPGKGQSNLKQ